MGKTVFTLGLLAVSMALLFVLGDTWSQLLNAAFTFVFVQISLPSRLRAPAVHLPSPEERLAHPHIGNLLLGLSRQWWIDKHNEHHGQNQMDLDLTWTSRCSPSKKSRPSKNEGSRGPSWIPGGPHIPPLAPQAISMLHGIEFLAAKRRSRWSKP